MVETPVATAQFKVVALTVKVAGATGAAAAVKSTVIGVVESAEAVLKPSEVATDSTCTW